MREGCQAGNLALPCARLCLPHPPEPRERVPEAVYFLSGMGVLSPSPSPHPVPTTRFRSCQIKSVPAPSPGWHGGQQLTGTKPGSEYPTACPMLGHAWGWGWGEPGACSWPRTALVREAGASPSCLCGGPQRTREQVPDVSVRPVARCQQHAGNAGGGAGRIGWRSRRGPEVSVPDWW